MIRSDGGSLYDWFKDNHQVGIGWKALAQQALTGATRQELQQLYRQFEPQSKNGRIVTGASQVWRFVNDVQVDDWVVSYSPSNRTYLIGQIQSSAKHQKDNQDLNIALVRDVKWQEQEILRDTLSANCRNSLGSVLTVFELLKEISDELLTISNSAKNQTIQTTNIEPTNILVDEQNNNYNNFQEIEIQAIEYIKDLINALDWDEMQELVAGVLRAMGYQTQISPQGMDRGKDIVASPDGFGFEHPRIIVEVKHRNGTIGSQDIRSFLGGRHKDDRGLYVSTGGFSKDARYEAERANIPLVLWTLDELTRTLLQYYEKLDIEAQRFIPLKKVYLPILK